MVTQDETSSQIARRNALLDKAVAALGRATPDAFADNNVAGEIGLYLRSSVEPEERWRLLLSVAGNALIHGAAPQLKASIVADIKAARDEREAMSERPDAEAADMHAKIAAQRTHPEGRPAMTAEAALRAITARIEGVYDQPDLLAFGPLGDLKHDIKEIAACVPSVDPHEPKFAIILDGGLVHCVVSKDPAYQNLSFAVIDYDTEGADLDEICEVTQEDGSTSDAIYSVHSIVEAGIDYVAVRPLQPENDDLAP